MSDRVQELDRALLRLRKGRKRRGFVLWLLSLVVIFVVGLFVFRSLLGLCLVDGSSMEPSLYPGDVLLFTRKGDLAYGDMILLESEDGGLTVKRVAGLGGDTVSLSQDGHLNRNGGLVEEKNVRYGTQNTAQWISLPCTVGPEEVFYLGDNRPISLDSRITGPVSRDRIVGVVIFSLRLSP